MSDYKISSNKEIARAIIFTINFLKEKGIPAWTTTIQKIIFFWLLSKTRSQTKKLYRAYLYGPYSDTVSDITTRLYALKYLDCDINIHARNYRINRTKISSEFLEQIKNNLDGLSKILDKLKEADLLNNVNLISNIAKIAWVETFEKKVKESKETVYSILTEKYSWDLSKDEFEIAYKKWQEIKPFITGN